MRKFELPEEQQMTVVLDWKPTLKRLKKNKRENPSSSPWLDSDSNLNPSSWSLDAKENSKFPFILLLNVALKDLKWKKKYLENLRQDNRVYSPWGPLWTRQPTKKTIESKGPLMIFMAQSVLVLAIWRKIWMFRLIVDLIFLSVGRAHKSQRPKRRSLPRFP